MSTHSSPSPRKMKHAVAIACGVCGSWILPLLMVAWMAPPAPAQVRPAIATGEVVANDVNIRSGPSMNHYVVSKLRAGQRLAIVGERGEWYEITPPEGTFSLISGEYVDVGNGNTGVVNGDNVRVRAGSSVNGSKYTVQTMLSRGAEVSIIKRNEDGFLRIVPPKDATLWINRTYLELVPEDRLRVEQTTTRPGVAEPKTPPETVAPLTATDLASPTAGAHSAAHDLPEASASAPSLPEASTIAGSSLDRTLLGEIDSDMKQELKKPAADRDLSVLIERYTQVASQTDDLVARQYAHGRIAQLQHVVELHQAAERLRRLETETESARRRFLSDRTRLPRVQELPREGFDARGELRVSSLYAGGTIPKRFRLVEPDLEFAKTIGYVEIPEGSSIDAEAFLGRLVGVHALTTRLLPGGVDSVPVYVAGDLVALDSIGRAP